MKQKQILILGALGLGAYLLLRKKSSSTGKESPLPPDNEGDMTAPKVGIAGCTIGNEGDMTAPKVGIAGCTIGSTYSNLDTVTSIFGLKGKGSRAKNEYNRMVDAGIGSIYKYNHPKGLTHCQDGTYSDSHKGACSYHGGAHEIKLRKGMRDYTGKGNYEHYMSYRKAYKNTWAKMNRDKVVTL